MFYLQTKLLWTKNNFFDCWHSKGTRLHAPACLIKNLRAKEEMERAAQEGYNFPDTRETLERAFEAIAQQGMEEEEEEKGLIHE